jgi:outer membrane immunogenic protein
MKNFQFGIALILALSSGASAVADEGIMEDFDSLGGNDVLLERARSLNPTSTVSIVQDRIVDRRLRFELAPEVGRTLGGDSYQTTNRFGANLHFHITPKWSVGAKYSYLTNKLSAEGESLINDTSIYGQGLVPEIDYGKQEYMGLVNFYPIYGKLNMFDLGIAHFDVYVLAGAGQIVLRSGPTPTWTAGGGIGFWISQHLTMRFELRYQTYTAKRFLGETTLDLTNASVQFGYLL